MSDFSEAGLYYVKAAVYRTFSAISSEVVSEPVPVNLEKIETSGLEDTGRRDAVYCNPFRRPAVLRLYPRSGRML